MLKFPVDRIPLTKEEKNPKEGKDKKERRNQTTEINNKSNE